MFIGEGPGYHEDQQGRPFVGPAGKLLDQLISSIGLTRRDVYITNIVKCRPPGNRDPLPSEVEACRHWLDSQVELIKPKVIATLGRHSLSRFVPGETIGKAHGRARMVEGKLIFPLHHPAAALYQESFRKVLEEDFRRIPALLAEQPAQQEDGSAESEADAAPEAKEEPKQLGLF